MKTRSLIISVLVVMMAALISCNQPPRSETIPVTTASEKAREYYEKASQYADEMKFDAANAYYDKAVQEDPNFFRVYFDRAIWAYNFQDMEQFNAMAQQAFTAKAQLSDGEEIMKQVLEKLVEDPKADVTPLFQQLVQEYPKDKYSYLYLSYFQDLNNMPEEAIESAKKAISLDSTYAPAYNMLGYYYLAQDNYDNAEKAFDEYIALDSLNANPYDSKGDFFMAVKMYQKAHDSYIKAYEIDTTFQISLKKAQKAQVIIDSLMTE